jgi:hypothetical protein
VFEAEGPTPSILTDVPRNLALFAFGGAIVSYTSDYATYRASRLIDGEAAQEWRSRTPFYLPQEFVFAFHDDAVALVDRIVLTTPAATTAATRIVSVATSLSGPVDGFEEAGQFTLKQVPGPQSFPIRRKARFVKLKILENFGSPIYTSLGEVQLLEGTEAGYQSVLFGPGGATG